MIIINPIITHIHIQSINHYDQYLFCKTNLKTTEHGKKEIIGFRKVGAGLSADGQSVATHSEEVVVAELFHGPTLAFKVRF